MSKVGPRTERVKLYTENLKKNQYGTMNVEGHEVQIWNSSDVLTSPQTEMHLQPDTILKNRLKPNPSIGFYRGYDFYIIVNVTPIRGQLLFFNFYGDIKSEYGI